MAVDLADLKVPLTQLQIKELLGKKGVTFHFLQVIRDLRACKDLCMYKRNARFVDAPAVTDCSSLIKWAFGRAGIKIPRLTIQQRDFGIRVPLEHVRPLDLIFTPGARRDYFHEDRSDGVGHVGLITSQQTVIHMTPHGLIEEPIARLLTKRDFRGAVRIIANPFSTTVLEIPKDFPTDIESSDCIKWYLLRQLPMVEMERPLILARS